MSGLRSKLAVDLRDTHSSEFQELKSTVDYLTTALDKLKTAQSAPLRTDSSFSEFAICSLPTEEDLPVAPTTFTVTEVNRRKRQNIEWYSSYFLSHPQGYQLQLRVDCGGVMDGKGTHLSVFVYITKGDHDKHLKWPFEGSVTVCLMDQQGSLNHEKVIEFPKGMSSEIAGFVKEGPRAKRGNGFAQFLPLDDLSSYVKDKSLLFNVAVVVVKPKTLLAGLFS